MTRKHKPFFAALLAVLLVLTCMVPLVHAETATQETASDAAQNFIDAVNALDRDAILAASNAWGLASQAWQADQKNEELTAALDEAIAAQDEATQPLYAAEDLYYELSEEEQQREDVQTAYSALCSLYTAMCSAMDNPVAPGTGTDDPPPEDPLSVLYGDLPDAPTGSYMGSAGLPIATGETKISISGWKEDLSASGYLNAEALNSDSLTLTAGMEDGEDFTIVPILTQVEYPANNSVSYITLPEDVTLLGYDLAPAENPARLLEQTHTETSAAVSGIYVQASHDFTALFTYVAGDGTRLEKALNVQVRADADAIPTLYSTNNAAVYSRPTPSVTTGKITSVQKINGSWLIWFNGQDAYCCDHGKNGQPAGCPTYNYTHTSTVDATQYVPGDHYGNQMRIWGGLDQLSMGLLTVRESDDFSTEFCARNSSTYSASDAAVLEYAARIYNDQQLYIIEHYPGSQAAQIYLSSARAAMGLSTGADTYAVAGYYTYIYDSGDPGWQRVALVGESFSEGEDEGGEEGPPPTYDASWSVDVTESASASFSVSMTIKVDKTANITHERLNDAEITVSGSPANGSLDGGSWSLTPSQQVICTVNGDGSVTFTYQGSVTKSVSRSASGSVTGKSSQSEADSEAASQRAAAESSLRSEARTAAQNQANAIANAAAQQARAFLVRETGVPHGFDATASSEQGQTVQPDGSSTAVIYNQPWQCSVKWEKLDNITGGRLTEDTRFTFYEWNTSANDYEVSPNYRVVRLADGTYTVRCTNSGYTDWQEGFVYYTQTNLGRFKIMETTAAYGYNYNPWSVEFTISKQNDTAHYLGANADKNQPGGNKLILHKTDSETGNEIASDAVFSLYEWNAQRGLYEISTNYAIVRDADGSYTVKCLHSDWAQAQHGSLYFEDTLCDTRQDTDNHDETASAHPVYYTDYNDSAYCVEFEITSERVYQVIDNAYDDMDDYIVTEQYFNHETLGQITIRKQGKVLTGYSDGQFIYTTENLAGATFEIRAKGDIATPDRQGTFWYRDGDLVAAVTTGRDGQIDSTAFAPNGTEAMYDFLSVSHDGAAGEVSITLPLGTYEIRETTAPYGFTLSEQVYIVTLGWDNQHNDLVMAQAIAANGERKEYSIVNAKDTTAQQKEEQVLPFTNERVIPVPDAPGKIGVGIFKKDRENDTMLAGAVYRLLTVNDIYDVHGNKLANAGDLLATSDATDEHGFAWFPVDAPMRGEQYAAGHTVPEDSVWTAAYNSGQYTIVEVKAPAGYLLDSTPMNVSFTYPGQNVAYQVVNATNTNLRTTVHISKQDITNGNELPGAELVITDENGTEIEKWISTDVPYTIRGLELEKEYTLTEHQAPTGYAIAESITFKLTQNGNDQRNEVFYKDENGEWQVCDGQTVVMQDDIIKVDISKTDIVTGEELPGATLQIYDSEGQLVEQWVSTDTPHRIDRLPAGSYTLLELTAPEGYGIAEKVVFEVLPTGEIQTVTMKDAPALYIHKTDVGGKELPGATLSICDETGTCIVTWTSTSQPKQLPVTGPNDTLPGGIMLSDETIERVYTLHEDAAPAGYRLAQDIQFKVLRTPESKLTVYYRANPNEPWRFVDSSHLTMVDELLPPAPVSEPEEPQPPLEPTPAPTPAVRRIPQTGDDSPLVLLVVLAGLSAATLAVLLYWRHHHKTNDLPPENDPQYEVKDHEGRDL